MLKTLNRVLDKIGRILQEILNAPSYHERQLQTDRGEAEARYRELLARRDQEDCPQEIKQRPDACWAGQGYGLKATAVTPQVIELEPIPVPEIIEVPIESLPVLQPQDNETLTRETQDTQPENREQRRAEVYAALDEANAYGVIGYEGMIDFVRDRTGKGCSKRMITRWRNCKAQESVA